MKADLSRNTFDRDRHYSSVRLQQGRVVTDADWNEQADITRYRAERQARDTIGACGAPLDAAGYGLVAETNALSVHALDADLVWVLAEDGALLASDDGGAGWALTNLGTAEHLRAAATAGNTGWIVGDGGTLRRTLDAGASWTTHVAGTVAALRGVAAIGSSLAWAVGDGGVVVLTEDGGAGWRTVQTAAARLYAVGFADATNELAVGQDGMILSTADGGDTWAAVASGTTAHLRALARVGTASFWAAAGEDGTILRSQDGGASWQPVPTPSDATLHAIAFRDADEGWAAGAEGTLLHSLDGGLSWLEETPGATATLRGLTVFAAEPAWAVGDGGVALRLGGGSPYGEILELPAVNLSILPGRAYANGIFCEIEARCSYAHQSDGGAGARLGPGLHLIYLDAWQRHVPAIADPSIREVALGGPDTATRAQTVAQVRALPLPDGSPAAWTCDSAIPDWDRLVGTAPPRLAARAEPQLAAASLCEIAATAGYRRLENQLYRVEVHDGGASPTFKWSRENGSVAYAVVSVSIDDAAHQTTVRLAARGRDANLDLAAHDRVELTDDAAELAGRCGKLMEYLADGDDALEFVLSGVPDGTLGRDPSRHPLLRRWDQRPAAAGAHALPIVGGSWIELEDGVQVHFEPGGAWRPGDYWQIPARTITGDVEWPRDEHGAPVARGPAGIAHAFCRLGIVEVAATGALTILSDCREIFPPLTALQQLHYVSGDGQDAAPGAPLPQPLVLRVSRGNVPVTGAGTRFEIESGGGMVGDGLAASQVSHETATDADGLAQCFWTLGPGAAAPGRFQRVRASLLDSEGDDIAGQVVVYCATASLLLHYVSGDGQEAAAGGGLPYPLQLRVVNGGDGIAGVRLDANVEEGGGALAPASVTTNASGYASFAWQLGAGGPQRVAVRLADASGAELQRLEYGATVRTVATGGGGCEVTIGEGGQFPELSNDLLRGLIGEPPRPLCLCFLPGEHRIDGIEVDGGGTRLSLHGCGPTARLTSRGGVILVGFAELELRDLAINLMDDRGISLNGNGDLRLTNLLIRSQEATEPCLRVGGGRVTMSGCAIGAGQLASAVFEALTGDCRIDGNRFESTVWFYGDPRDLQAQAYVDLLDNPRGMDFRAGEGRLHFCGNDLQLLTIGGDVSDQLRDQQALGLFQSAVLHGNTFGLADNVFAAMLLSFSSNSFNTEPEFGRVWRHDRLACRRGRKRCGGTR